MSRFIKHTIILKTQNKFYGPRVWKDLNHMKVAAELHKVWLWKDASDLEYEQ